MLAVSIVSYAFVFNKSATTDCDEISVIAGIQGNEKLASKMTLGTKFTSKPTMTSSTTKTVTTKIVKSPTKSDDKIFVKKCDVDDGGRQSCKIISLADLDPSERDEYDPRKNVQGKIS